MFKKLNKYFSNVSPYSLKIQKAEGNYLTDYQGKKYLDLTSSLSANNLGHLNPDIVQAVKKQLSLLTLTSRAIYSDKLHEVTEQLCKQFNYDKSILVNINAEAGETAIKFARRWGYEVKQIQPNQAKVIFCKNHFWAKTHAARASSINPQIHQNAGPYEQYNFSIIPYNNIQQIEYQFQSDPNICAIFIEPMQTSQGMEIPHNQYLKQVRELCDKYQVLLIMDEMITGLGRTGNWLLQDKYNIKADMICLGQGLSGGIYPVGSVLGNKEIFDVIASGTHGSTYGGNPMACITVMETIKIMNENNLVQNAKQQGEYLQQKLQEIQNKYQNDIRINGQGLIYSMEIISERFNQKQILEQMQEKGVLLVPDDKYIKFLPSLIINKKDIDFVIENLEQVLSN